MAVELTDANFKDKVLDSDQVALIDFWAEWCGPCKMIAPAVEELSNDYDGKAIIGKLNVDENPQTSMQYGIRNIPTILFIKGGEIVDKQVGVVPKSVLEDKLKAHM